MRVGYKKPQNAVKCFVSVMNNFHGEKSLTTDYKNPFLKPPIQLTTLFSKAVAKCIAQTDRQKGNLSKMNNSLGTFSEVILNSYVYLKVSL